MADDLGQLDDTLTGTVTAAGTLVITIKSARLQVWVVSQVAPEMPTAPGGAQCSLRKNGSLVCPAKPRRDALGGDPSITVRPADLLTIEWSGCTPGDIGTVWFSYRLEPW